MIICNMIKYLKYVHAYVFIFSMALCLYQSFFLVMSHYVTHRQHQTCLMLSYLYIYTSIYATWIIVNHSSCIYPNFNLVMPLRSESGTTSATLTLPTGPSSGTLSVYSPEQVWSQFWMTEYYVVHFVLISRSSKSKTPIW